MQWTDEGIVLGVRRHGESSVIAELMTYEHGRHLGLVRGGAGTRMRPVLQPGNTVQVKWRARLDEHLGMFSIEGLRLRAGSLLSLAHAVHGVTHVAALLRLLPERDPHPAIYSALGELMDHMEQADEAALLLVRFELGMLAELGFGLDLAACAVSGSEDDLAYVSPRTGRAVSRSAAGEWAERLLALPAFLHEDAVEMPSHADLVAGMVLTRHFLERWAFAPRGLPMPMARDQFAAALGRTKKKTTAEPA